MGTDQSLTFKTASGPEEFDQVFELNYRTFVEEIPQHAPNLERRLVDRFHAQNTYLIALETNRLVGMMAVRGDRPFSLDEKLGPIDAFLPPGRRLCEIRLLSVLPTHRNGHVFQGLLRLLLRHGRERGYTLAVISGTVRQLRLYRHLGFVPFGPRVGTGDALYQPMYLTLETFEEQARAVLAEPQAISARSNPVSFLPGPVTIRPQVRDAFHERAISHRSAVFKDILEATQRRLCQLTQAGQVSLFLGSGTLANDVVAGQLAVDDAPGVIAEHGEFGERLVDHARRFRLRFDVFSREWGAILDLDQLDAFIQARPDTRWLWTTVCETSTGVLNDIEALKRLCARHHVSLCLDAISAIGTVPIDLRGVHLTSGASGKGLGAYPGLALVFYHRPVRPQPERLPRYLDLGFYAAHEGVPFTQSSNLLGALHAALTRYEVGDPFQELRDLADWLQPRLRRLGLNIVAPDDHASPAVFTLTLPEGCGAGSLGDRLAEAGFLVSYRSDYLAARQWLQICLMGECSRRDLAALLREIKRLLTLHEPAGRR